MNRHMRTIIVAPMTSKGFPYPTRLAIHFENKKGFILFDQIRTVDKKRIHKVLGKIKPEESKKVSELLQEMFSW